MLLYRKISFTPLIIGATLVLVAGCESAVISGQPAIGAAEESALLLNTDFEQGAEYWTACRDAGNIEASMDENSGSTSLSVGNSDCFYQITEAAPNDNLRLTCSGKTSGNGWASVALAFLDSTYQPLGMGEKNFPDESFTTQSIELMAPANTRYTEILMYGESRAHFDDCTLESFEPTTVASENILVNAGFEDGMDSWQTCNGSTGITEVVTSASAGSKALMLNESGCMYQQVAISAESDHTLSCQAGRDGVKYSSIRLQYLADDFSELARKESPVVGRSSFTPRTVTLPAPPTGSAYAVATLYGEARTIFDECTLTYRVANP